MSLTAFSEAVAAAVVAVEQAIEIAGLCACRIGHDRGTTALAVAVQAGKLGRRSALWL